MFRDIAYQLERFEDIVDDIHTKHRADQKSAELSKLVLANTAARELVASDNVTRLLVYLCYHEHKILPTKQADILVFLTDFPTRKMPVLTAMLNDEELSTLLEKIQQVSEGITVGDYWKLIRNTE